MIISHRHRYLFIEIPLTGSWAIHHELRNYYDGVPILHKHATYPEFSRQASEEEKEYFVFACVRNPLDTAVSRYFKLKTDHKGAFSDPESAKQMLTDFSDYKKYAFVHDLDASFEQFFQKYYRWSYSDLIDVSSKSIDFVMRYENLQNDFSMVLQRLDIPQVQPVPVTNKTQGRAAEWSSYYSPDMIPDAKRIFGSFMAKWGYQFPTEWGSHQISWPRQAEFHLLSWFRKAYLTGIRYNTSWYAKGLRLLRARLVD